MLCLMVVGLLGVTASLSRTRTEHIFSVSARVCILRAKVYTTTTVHDERKQQLLPTTILCMCAIGYMGPLLLAAAAALLPLYRCCCCVSNARVLLIMLFKPEISDYMKAKV